MLKEKYKGYYGNRDLRNENDVSKGLKRNFGCNNLVVCPCGKGCGGTDRRK